MALTKVRSREILWEALKRALGLTENPKDLLTYFRETDYHDLFTGWPENEFDIADKKVALAVKYVYEENKINVDMTEGKIEEKSKIVREETNESKNKVKDFFMPIHKTLFEMF